MKLFSVVFTILILSAQLKPPPLDDPLRPDFQKGLTYTTWPIGNFAHPDARLALLNIRNTGADWIALIVTQYQDDITTTQIYPTADTSSDAELVHAIRSAHALGLKIMLKPQLDPLHTDVNHWRGMIGESFTENQWVDWFVSYREYILHYAQLAAENDVEQFSIGVELNAASRREKEWRILVKDIRAIYPGPLVYAANHGWAVTDLTWWDAVDYIGLDAYYNLPVGTDDPSVEQIKTAWKPIVAEIDRLQRKWKMPVLITELGYLSQDGNIQHPWNWLKQGEVDLGEQADAYQAAFESWVFQPWLHGIYWWDFGTDPFEGGPCDQLYTPNDKPAEEILRLWYGGNLPSQPPGTPDAGSAAVDIYQDELANVWKTNLNNGYTKTIKPSSLPSRHPALSVDLQPDGSLEFSHPGIDSSPFTWLEFHLRLPVIADPLRISIRSTGSASLRRLPLCRYMQAAPSIDEWQRVVIPLEDFRFLETTLSGFLFENISLQAQTFELADFRLLYTAADQRDRPLKRR